MHAIKFLFFLGPLLFACQNEKHKAQKSVEESHAKKIAANKIRFEKLYEYEYRFGKPDTSSVFLKELIEYDSLGYVISKAVFNKESYMKEYDQTEEFKYDSARNNIETINRDVKGNVTSITRNTFLRGLNTERLFYQVDGKLTGKVIYKYDNNGNRTELISYDADGRLEYKTQSDFNETGDELLYKKFDRDGKLTDRTVQMISDTANIFLMYDSTNSLTWKQINKLDTHRKVVEVVNTNGKDEQQRRLQYKYDNNFVIEIVEFASHGDPISFRRVMREKFKSN